MYKFQFWWKTFLRTFEQKIPFPLGYYILAVRRKIYLVLTFFRIYYFGFKQSEDTDNIPVAIPDGSEIY